MGPVFEPTIAQPAGQGATLEYTFRNGHRVSFSAREIKIEKLLTDVKNYLKRPGRKTWIGNRRMSVYIGTHRLRDAEPGAVSQRQGGQLGPQPEAAPRPFQSPRDRGHAVAMCRRPISSPPGWPTATPSEIVVWLAGDTAIVKRPLNGQQLYLTADAVTGKPLGKMNLEFFGYRQRWDGKGKYDFDTANFSGFADAYGETTLRRQAALVRLAQIWITIARGDEGRLAYLGFTGVWYPNYYDAEYNQTKVFTITDRPVYRPGQTVKYKFWIRHAKYDEANV